jgi:DNA modification methylase
MTQPTWRMIEGAALTALADLPDGSVQTCVTSPPYWWQRDYDVEGQAGLEPTPTKYVGGMVAVFEEVRRVLRDDGTLWLNLGDSYNNRTVARPSSHRGGFGHQNDSSQDVVGGALGRW